MLVCGLGFNIVLWILRADSVVVYHSSSENRWWRDWFAVKEETWATIFGVYTFFVSTVINLLMCTAGYSIIPFPSSLFWDYVHGRPVKCWWCSYHNVFSYTGSDIMHFDLRILDRS